MYLVLFSFIYNLFIKGQIELTIPKYLRHLLCVDDSILDTSQKFKHDNARKLICLAGQFSRNKNCFI